MKHILVRGAPVKVVKQKNGEFRAAGTEVPRGSMIVTLETDDEIFRRRDKSPLPFVARIIGGTWRGYGTDPIHAIQRLVVEIMKDGGSDYSMSMPEVMLSIREEI